VVVTGVKTGMMLDLRRMGVWEAVANNVAFIATPLLMPSLFARTGWTIGVLFTLYSALLTYFNGVILGDICTLHPRLYSYPLIAEEVFARIGTGGDPTVPRRDLQGLIGKRFVQAIQFACFFLTGIAELIYFQQYLAQLFSKYKVCQRGWLLIAAGVALPFMMVPTFRESRWLAVAALVLICGNQVVFFYEVFHVAPWNSCDVPPDWSHVTPLTVIHGVTGIGYAFGGHGLFPEQIREMAHPERWTTVMRWTYAIITPLYLAMGLLGYYAYGRNAQANLNANYPNNIPNQASIIFQSFQEVYFILASGLVLVLQVELALGVSPYAVCNYDVTQKSANGLCEGEVELAETDHPDRRPERGLTSEACSWVSNDSTSAESSSSEPSSREGSGGGLADWISLRACGVPPVGFRLIFRTIFLGSQTLIASLLLGGDGDVLLAVQSLSGAVGYMMMSYVLPLLFGWVLLPRVSTWRCALYAVSFVGCTVLAIAGVIFDTEDLVEASGGFGQAVSCEVTEDLSSEDGCIAALGRAMLANASAVTLRLELQGR